MPSKSFRFTKICETSRDEVFLEHPAKHLIHWEPVNRVRTLVHVPHAGAATTGLWFVVIMDLVQVTVVVLDAHCKFVIP